MNYLRYTLLALALGTAACGPRELAPDDPIECERCAEWNEPQEPFRVHGNTWYVGTDGLSAILIESDDGLILIDGGLPQSAAAIEANIRALGFDPLSIKAILVSHVHFDHAGSQNAFRKARFHLQDREMSYATGRYMCHDRIRLPFDVENVTDMVRHVYDGRVAFHDGDEVLDSGLSLHLVGGHSHGLQIVRVHTRRGWVVVASDAAHLYAHMETGNPFPIVFNVGDMLEGHRRCHQLADSPDHVVPGHDPLVMARYPAVSKELEGIAVRLDMPPMS